MDPGGNDAGRMGDAEPKVIFAVACGRQPPLSLPKVPAL